MFGRIFNIDQMVMMMISFLNTSRVSTAKSVYTWTEYKIYLSACRHSLVLQGTRKEKWWYNANTN